MEKKLTQILQENFNPKILEVVNESYKHAGHSGDNGSGESHFKIIISSKDIPGSSRIEKHRKITEVLGNLAKEIHALSIELR